jgi:hypothetical protein
MNGYSNRVPKFTAESSLLSSKNAGGILTHSSADCYRFAENGNILNMAQVTCVRTSWCTNTCHSDPVTGENCCWRSDIQDCVCVPCHHTHSNCSCTNRVYKTEDDCISAGYSWCCLDPNTGLERCEIA